MHRAHSPTRLPRARCSTSALTVNTASVQYSDVASFSVTMTTTFSGQRPAGKVAFKIGTQSMGVADVTPVGGNAATATQWTAAWSGQLLEPSPSGTMPTGQMRPGTKIVSAQMLDPDSRFAMTNPTNK